MLVRKARIVTKFLLQLLIIIKLKSMMKMMMIMIMTMTMMMMIIMLMMIRQAAQCGRFLLPADACIPALHILPVRIYPASSPIIIIIISC